MLDRRWILAGLGIAGLATSVSGRLSAAAPIKPDDASALLVIDVQNCFLPGGSLAVKDGEQVVPVINKIAKGFANVVMTQDWHTAGHVSFASVHAGKKPFETIDLPYGKQVLWPDHCVQGTDGASLSKDLFCVGWTALDARKAGFETYVVEDACRGIDTQGSLAKAWADMAKAGVKRIQSGDLAV
jgi:nicotinamidase/pyrazinamidase